MQRYESLLEEKKRRNQALGIQDEFPISSDFSSINTKDTDDDQKQCKKEEDHHQLQTTKTNKGARRKVTTRTPTDFSEVSSGFSDETSNKATQTEERSGSFLCTIADGEDCKFSIYDDASPIDSRFRNRPEYRELFKEIFHILKKAAENREEGEKLPLLDDEEKNNMNLIHKVPPVTPANEDMPFIIDNTDTQSIASSMMSEQSVAMSECITKTERKKKKKKMAEKNNQENVIPSTILVEGESILTPYKRDRLDLFTVAAAKAKKRDRRNRRNQQGGDNNNAAGLPTPPRFFYGNGRKRREFNPFDLTKNSSSPLPQQAGPEVDQEWSGDSITIYNRNLLPDQQNAAASAEQKTEGKVLFKPSTASQDLQKLKKLELTYAEVLRRADQHQHQQTWKKQQLQQNRQTQNQGSTSSTQFKSNERRFYQKK